MSSDDADAPHGEPLATLTHARLRIAQGDMRGARALLREILDRRGTDPEAEELLRRIAGRADSATASEREESLNPPEPGDPASLGGDFRLFFSDSGGGRRAAIERLEQWLNRIGGDGDDPR
jgi:hypothetical protein